jgi:RNA-directed DNA polymerase
MADNNEQARPNTRQELYDRIRSSSKDEYILQDMVRLGYWESNKDAPSVSEQIIKRESELMRELSALLTERRRVEDQQTMLKELRKHRMLESRKKREENKLKREQQRKDKAENWKKRKEVEILYLGEKVSGGLNHTESNLEKLSRWKLPIIHTTAELAEKLEVSLGEIRFLSFSRDISKTHHYKRFFIQKKSGGTRLISAPMPRLKKVQKWILENILNLITPKDVAHGFIKQKSIVTNARPHVGAEVVINMDLKDFFPSITYPRVKGVFESLGYSEAVATTLSLICTQPDVDEAELDTRVVIF